MTVSVRLYLEIYTIYISRSLIQSAIVIIGNYPLAKGVETYKKGCIILLKLRNTNKHGFFLLIGKLSLYVLTTFLT